MLLFNHSVMSNFVTPRLTAHQASLSFTISWSLLELMSIKFVMPSDHFILDHLLLWLSTFSSLRVFSNKLAPRIRWPQYWSFCLTSVLPMNIQSWFPLGLTGLISLVSKGLSEISSTQFKSINFSTLNLLYCPGLTSVHDY